MRWLLDSFTLVAILIGFGVANADDATEMAKARAKASLALNQRQREAERTRATAAFGVEDCYTDAAKATAEAKRLRVPLVLWIAMDPTDAPELRRSLDEAIHLRIDSRPGGGTTPRVVIKGGDDNEYFVLREKIDAKTAEKIRSKWTLPTDRTTNRNVATIAEEITYYAAPMTFAPMAFPSAAVCST